MRFNFYFSFIFLIFLLFEVKGEEEKIIEKEKEKENEKEKGEPPKRKPRIKFINLAEEDNVPRRKSQTIELNSLNFDSIIQNGLKNRWLIIFYSESNSYSIKVKSKIDKIIEEKNYTSINNIKFASVDINLNFKLKTRFRITGIPVVILVENDKMLRIANFPDEETLKNNIEIGNIENSNSVKDFIHELTILDFILNIVSSKFESVTKLINYHLKKKIKYEISETQFSLFIVFLSCILSYILFNGLTKCFCEEKKIEKKDDDNNKDGEEKIDENKKEENNNINNTNNEEKKKIIEEKKEQEVKEKLNKENENSNKKGEIKKKEKKKKKE